MAGAVFLPMGRRPPTGAGTAERQDEHCISQTVTDHLRNHPFHRRFEPTVAQRAAGTLTSNVKYAALPHAVLIPEGEVSGLRKDSVAMASQLSVINKDRLVEQVGQVPSELMLRLDQAVVLVLGLGLDALKRLDR